jgi:hypothetical protein
MPAKLGAVPAMCKEAKMAKFIYHKNLVVLSNGEQKQEELQFEAAEMRYGNPVLLTGDGNATVAQIHLLPGEWVAREDAVVK